MSLRVTNSAAGATPERKHGPGGTPQMNRRKFLGGVLLGTSVTVLVGAVGKGTWMALDKLFPPAPGKGIEDYRDGVVGVLSGTDLLVSGLNVRTSPTVNNGSKENPTDNKDKKLSGLPLRLKNPVVVTGFDGDSYLAFNVVSFDEKGEPTVSGDLRFVNASAFTNGGEGDIAHLVDGIPGDPLTLADLNPATNDLFKMPSWDGNDLVDPATKHPYSQLALGAVVQPGS